MSADWVPEPLPDGGDDLPSNADLPAGHDVLVDTATRRIDGLGMIGTSAGGSA